MISGLAGRSFYLSPAIATLCIDLRSYSSFCGFSWLPSVGASECSSGGAIATYGVDTRGPINRGVADGWELSVASFSADALLCRWRLSRLSDLSGLSRIEGSRIEGSRMEGSRMEGSRMDGSCFSISSSVGLSFKVYASAPQSAPPWSPSTDSMMLAGPAVLAALSAWYFSSAVLRVCRM